MLKFKGVFFKHKSGIFKIIFFLSLLQIYYFCVLSKILLRMNSSNTNGTVTRLSGADIVVVVIYFIFVIAVGIVVCNFSHTFMLFFFSKITLQDIVIETILGGRK